MVRVLLISELQKPPMSVDMEMVELMKAEGQSKAFRTTLISSATEGLGCVVFGELS